MDKTGIVLSLITAAAVILGPIIALDLQRRLDRGREARNRKLWVFKTLMSYRATFLSPTFVQALNLIDVEFDASSEKEKAVRNTWKILLDHFGDLRDPAFAANSSEKTATLTTNLLLAMGNSLGYDFDEVQIKKGAYYPMFLGNVEQEQHALRRGILDVLEGKRRIPVGIFEDHFPEINLRSPQLKPESKFSENERPPESKAEELPPSEDRPVKKLLPG